VIHLQLSMAHVAEMIEAHGLKPAQAFGRLHEAAFRDDTALVFGSGGS